jgi:hypothetical protein
MQEEHDDLIPVAVVVVVVAAAGVFELGFFATTFAQ